MKDFRDDIAPALARFRHAAMAWLGAVQCAAYSEPGRVKALAREREAETARSPSAWFEAAEPALRNALRSLDAQLAQEWEKRRDPRFDLPDEGIVFAHKLEEGIGRAFHQMETMHREARKLAVSAPERELMARAWKQAQESMRAIVTLYDAHCVEMTGGGAMLAVRGAVMEGAARN